MHVKSLTITSKFKYKSNLSPFEIADDITNYVFQLGGKKNEIFEKKLAHELNDSYSLIQVSNEFLYDNMLEHYSCCVMGIYSSSHVDCELVKIFATSEEEMHECCDTVDQILFHQLIYDSLCDNLRNYL